MISILVSLGLAFGMYVIFLKSASPGGKSPQAAVSTTTVEMQLVQLAQAERLHYAQNSSYATLEELAANGEFKMPNPDHEGYAYKVETSDGGFVATASHPASPGKSALDYPTLTIDQTMQVHHPDEDSAPAAASAPVQETASEPASAPAAAAPSSTAPAGGNVAPDLTPLPPLPASMAHPPKSAAATP